MLLLVLTFIVFSSGTYLFLPHDRTFDHLAIYGQVVSVLFFIVYIFMVRYFNFTDAEYRCREYQIPLKQNCTIDDCVTACYAQMARRPCPQVF